MKKRISFVALMLVAVMIMAALAGCTGKLGTDTTATPDTGKETESPTTGETDGKETNGETASGETTDESAGETSNESAGESETTDSESEETDVQLEGDDADMIELGNSLAGAVQGYYEPTMREQYISENKNMKLTYDITNKGNAQVTSLTDKKGNAYIENTMDVFIKMKDGNVYYSSTSIAPASVNIYRLGYYYYENRIENQVFSTDSFDNIKEINHLRVRETHQVTKTGIDPDANTISFRIDDGRDPYIILPNATFSAEDYSYIELTMRASGVEPRMEVFVKAGSSTQFNGEQRIEHPISADGKFHTYVIPLNKVPDYTDKVKGIRFDITGKAGATFEIAGIRVLGMGEGAPQFVSMQRSFLTYSDKMHQIIQIATAKETENVALIGIKTEIAAETVDKLVIKDIQGLHYSLEDKISWGNVKYAGFDIKGAGIFGYILPSDGQGGSMKITLDSERGVYVVEQYMAPNEFKLIPSIEGTGNANDFYMGNRIYTDTNHTFDKFIYEAECEINPLASENIVINPIKSGNTVFNGYDALRGYYKFSVKDSVGGFNGPFFEYPNRHYGFEFTVKGDDKDRQCYVVAYTTSGSLECSAVLDEQRMMLPIPVQVGKNFKGDGENTIYNLDDSTYGEAMVPFIFKANSSDTYSVLHLYQNWGNYPLKQISSIQYFSPYYHLSVGVTETNCIVPFGSGGLSLPDFRSCSAPLWKGQPQHNSCGSHSFVYYTDADGAAHRTRHLVSYIDSYGPTYAEMHEVFMSGDGKLKFTYGHMELPQTDENRTFYQIRIDVVEDLNIADFRNNFAIYNVASNDPTGLYQRVGYIDENNKHQVVSAVKAGEEEKLYKLGDECPYFSFFDMDDYSSQHAEGYSNVAMIIYNSTLIIGGEEQKADFIVKNSAGRLTLTLDRDSAEFKAGDSFVINGILLPWGSQELEDVYDKVIDETTGEKYQDKNVRDVREDSLLNPMTVTPVKDCERVVLEDSIFLPRAKTTNGKSAEFTVKGGNNNIAVRVYGFNKLTVPTVEELVDGEWKTIELSSANHKDQSGYSNVYDGYTVFYDGDGTYSYAFAFEMTKGGERTFRITADTDFEGWGEEEDPTKDLPLNVYLTPDNIASLGCAIGTPFGCSKYEFNEEGFFRFYGNGKNGEIYLIPYKTNAFFNTTGQYVVLKYRYPTTNSSNVNRFDFFAATSGGGATGNGDWFGSSASVEVDGEWHVIIADLSVLDKLTPNEDGSYKASFVRYDVFNASAAIPETDYVDIAYFGMSDNLEDILKLNSDLEYVTFCPDSGSYKRIDPKTGEEIKAEEPDTPDVPEIKADYNVLIDSATLAGIKPSGCDVAISEDGSYARYTAKGAGESYVIVYSNSAASTVTGQYAIFKYRVPSEAVGTLGSFEIFASTEASAPVGGSSVQFGKIVSDGKWHVMIVDLSGIETYNAADGAYSAKHLRLDVINQKLDSNFFVDVAYVALHDDLDEIMDYLKNEGHITSFDAAGKATVTVNENAGGEETETEENPGFPPAGEEVEKVEDTSNIAYFAGPDALASISSKSGAMIELSKGESFTRFIGGGNTEAYINLYKSAGAAKVTGQYIAIKYRFYEKNALKTSCFDFYAATDGRVEANGSGDHFRYSNVIQDGEWHVLIVDLSVIEKYTAKNGSYSATLIRFDMFNAHKETFGMDTVMDIAYIALDDNKSDLYAIASGMENVTVVSGNSVTVVDPATGNPVQ